MAFFIQNINGVKKPGQVIFEFLPPILTSPDRDIGDILNQLEMDVEEKSSHIMEEARESLKKRSSFLLSGTVLTVCLGYTLYWFFAAHLVKQSVTDALADTHNNPNIVKYSGNNVRVRGFPTKLKLSLPKQTIQTHNEIITINSIDAESWPLPGMPVTFSTGPISIEMKHWRGALDFDSITGTAIHWKNILNIENVTLTRQDTQGLLSGTIKFLEPYPIIDLDIAIKNHQSFLHDLVSRKIVKEKPAAIAAMALQALQKDGVIKSRIVSQENKLYLGPIKIHEFPNTHNAALLADGKPSSYATRRIKPAPDR